MLNNTASRFAILALLAFGTALAPAAAFAAPGVPSDVVLVNYGHCDEQPSMPDCRSYDTGEFGGTSAYPHSNYGGTRHAHGAPQYARTRASRVHSSLPFSP
jgi:hypothetical protein